MKKSQSAEVITQKIQKKVTEHKHETKEINKRFKMPFWTPNLEVGSILVSKLQLFNFSPILPINLKFSLSKLIFTVID